MSIYDTLNREQKEAVLKTDGPLLLLAGAGSGKTRVLTHRIAYLIDEMGVNPWNILAITFTNKAAKEMRERVDALVGFGADQIWVSTFHAACMRILRRHIDRLGYDNHFAIYDTDDQKAVMKEICKRLNIDTKTYKERTLLGAISSAKDELVDVREYEIKAFGDYVMTVTARVYREYQETLKKNNALDFDDIIGKTVELFKSCPEVLNSYQERFRYIMVDEYQDTNTAQFELVRLLADKYRNLCVVGDDDQSIYKFRGANIRNILDYEKVYPEACVIKLEQNYRSTQSILDAANAVISNNTGRKEKALWTDKGAGSLVHFRQFDNAFEEAEFIAEDVARRVKKGNAGYKDCAVLYRTNAQSRLLEERMILEGIPYNVVGGVNFYSRREVKDILSYLKTIDNGQDDLALRRIINVPKRSIGATTVERVADYAQMRGISLFDAMTQADQIMSLGRGAGKLAPFVRMIRDFREKSKDCTIAELIGEIVEQTQYPEYLRSEDDESAEDRLSNIDELITKAVAYEESHETPSLSEFLEEIALVADIDNVDGSDERVLLMTLHSAKGLEFPFVYIAGMEDGLFPSYMTIMSEDPSDLEEERRLAYVGITRAKEELTLTCAKMRMIRGETQYNPISRFVREIPTKLLDNSVPASKTFRETIPEVFDFRPKATLRPKVTAKADKPYIARGIGSLNQLAGISKGAPAQSLEELEYGVGDSVRHVKYGQGTVLKIEKEPRDYKVTVNFEKAGQKIMYASFAKLKRL
ncbi:DNA helicase PcrA [Candidatus Acetatifactor stercoripullorum]|uniref:DNA helicase PcrA n=1 Tax=Candidatus Acetatifactor stercoripullorum TaxID=2838414 RepID=UPI00298E3963|nr:DNA helicase PcrA [Candidatus Acetatifactor stercoripullorum]